MIIICGWWSLIVGDDHYLSVLIIICQCWSLFVGTCLTFIFIGNQYQLVTASTAIINIRKLKWFTTHWPILYKNIEISQTKTRESRNIKTWTKNICRKFFTSWSEKFNISQFTVHLAQYFICELGSYLALLWQNWSYLSSHTTHAMHSLVYPAQLYSWLETV